MDNEKISDRSIVHLIESYNIVKKYYERESKGYLELKRVLDSCSCDFDRMLVQLALRSSVVVLKSMEEHLAELEKMKEKYILRKE